MPSIVPAVRFCLACRAVFLAVACTAGLVASEGRGDDGPNPAAAILEAKGLIEGVEASLAADKPKRAAADFKAAAHAVEALLALPRPPAGVRPLQDRLRKIRESLEFEGVDVSEVVVPVAKSAPKPKAAASPKPAGLTMDSQPGFTRQTTAAAAGVSFSRDVSPMLVKSCGGCHVSGRKGGFQMASFDALAKSGMVQVGDAQASRLVEVIQSGDMPRGGGRVPPNEMAMLMKWIDSGAAFDGKDQSAPLESLAAAAPGDPQKPNALPAKPAAPAVATRPPANGVSFAFEVAPVLLEQCSGCHGGRRPRGELGMGSYAALLRGGESGSPIVPGKGGDSLLVRKLVGMRIEGQRMPLGRPPLSENVIATIRRWIDEGAALDLLAPDASLENLAAAGRAAKLSHEDLREVRYAAGGKFWSRVIPDEQGISARRDDVLVVGNLTQAEIDEVAERAEKLVQKLHDEYGLGEDEPLSKGGCVVCVCRKSYDYSSFWQTILGKEKPDGFFCHAGLAGDVLYGACVVPKEGLDAEVEITAELAEQLATAAWLSRGAPEWFAIGAGKLAAAKLAAKAASVAAAGNPRAAAPSPPPAEVFLGRDIDPGERAAVSRRFVGDLAGRGKLTSLVAAMKKIGAAPDGFSKAFAGVFGGPPEAAYAAWVGGSGRR